MNRAFEKFYKIAGQTSFYGIPINWDSPDGKPAPGNTPAANTSTANTPAGSPAGSVPQPSTASAPLQSRSQRRTSSVPRNNRPAGTRRGPVYTSGQDPEYQRRFYGRTFPTRGPGLVR